MKIIGLIVSSLRRDHLGLYGNRWLKLEHFERLGKAATVFTEARCARADAPSIRMELLTGLDSRRAANSDQFFNNYNPSLTLPAQLTQKGYQTALFTDHYPMLWVYERLNVFDMIHFVPGQAADRHLPEGFASAVYSKKDNLSKILTGNKANVPECDRNRFLRNQLNSQELGHPAVRLFDAAGRFLNELDENSDWFVLIDSFGLTPPWNPPADFTHFRVREDKNKIAWPLPCPVDLKEEGIAKQINFFRRAYADQCLFFDAQLGIIESSLTSLIKNGRNMFFIMSDHGVLIGDDGGLLHCGGGESDVVTCQALVMAGSGFSKEEKVAGEVSTVDLFKTLLHLAEVEKPPLSDGKIIDFPL
ncbi:MAG: sulfatase-like hydrolase/transferase [Phycisphaerae bacterium]|nr:sulfatase-like hydrolase/transferase [Phycisphaerae bacterium]